MLEGMVFALFDFKVSCVRLLKLSGKSVWRTNLQRPVKAFAEALTTLGIHSSWPVGRKVHIMQQLSTGGYLRCAQNMQLLGPNPHLFLR
ncbi:conserved hypothetical protein [Ricinus communis]|uniref:Uncharacterized protein n=1 Tax=Ricinus communis TaxID=3988 RepID=B9T9S8_RICCO|nr:conserved hypothetical protein [Ricinus communis]